MIFVIIHLLGEAWNKPIVTSAECDICPRGVMDCRIVVSEFELQSGYYVHLAITFTWRQIPLGNVRNPYPPELNSTSTVLEE